MADIFDEVNEDLKRDQMQKLWSRFGKYVILVVSIVVLGVGGRQGYTTWQGHQAATAATAYHNALGTNDLKKALTAELDQLSPGYAMLAKFRIAAAQALAEDYAAAEKSYLALSTDPAVRQLYQQAALLLSVMNAPVNRSADELATRLAVLEGQAGPPGLGKAHSTNPSRRHQPHRARDPRFLEHWPR